MHKYGQPTDILLFFKDKLSHNIFIGSKTEWQLESKVLESNDLGWWLHKTLVI